MPTEIYIAVLAMCASVVLLTVLLVVTAIYLRVKLNGMELTLNQTKGDLAVLIKEARDGILEVRQTAARATKSMDDIGHITHTARRWTDRADRLADAVGQVAEPPLFFLSRNAEKVSKIGMAVLQALLNPKR